MKKLLLLSLLTYVLSLSIHAQTTRINEEFTATTLPPTGWSVTLNQGTLISQTTTAANSYGRTGTSGTLLSNFYNVTSGNRAQFDSRAFGATVSGDSVRFDVAHAAYPSYTDSLIIHTNSGTGFNRLIGWGSSQTVNTTTGITTVAAQGGAFTPTSSQWTTKALALPSGTVQVRFEFYSAYGNNLYIDRVIVDSFFVQGMSYDSSSAFIVTNAPVLRGTQKAQILGVKINVTGNVNALVLNRLKFNTDNTTSPSNSIDTARVYFTGNSSTFSTNTLFGTVVNPNGGFAVNGAATLTNGYNYVWLTYNVKPTATIADFVDARCDSIRLDATSYAPAVTTPGAGRQIVGPMTGTYSIGAFYSYPNFTTIAEAFDNLALRGVSGNVTLLLADASYTLTTTAVLNTFANSGNYTVTIKPTSTTTIIGSIASAPVLRILASRVTIDGSYNTGGTTRDLTIQNTNTTAPQVVIFASVGTGVVSNCAVKHTKIINGATTSSAVVFSDIAATAGNFTNITFYNNEVSQAYIGLFAFGNAGTFTNLTVDSNNFNSTSAKIRIVGIYTQNVTGVNIRKNVIGNFSNTDNETKAGIWLASGTTNAIVSQNQISNIGVAGVANGGNGIRVTTAITSAGVLISNNMIDSIYGLGVASAHSINNPSGISMSGTQSGVQIYYNTIRMGGYTLSATSTSAGVRLMAGSVADIRNNYINNTLNGASATGAFAICAETSTSQFAAINNNNYYVGTTGNFGIGRIATTNYASISAWKSAVTADANSFTDNTPFTSVSDLHIPASTTTQMESGGTVLSGITTDFDGDTRSTTTPDVGADEFSGVGIDLTPPAIAYTPLSNGAGTTTRTLTGFAGITDASGVSTSSGSAPRFYYKRKSESNAFNGNSSSDNGWKYVEASNTTSPFSFTINYSILFGGSASVGDTILYFVVAQDISSAGNTSCNPLAGFAGSAVYNITAAPTTPYSYIITSSPLSGAYSVGSSGAYTTLTAAITDINLRGVTGVVTLNLADATYGSGETFPIIIAAYPNASATNRLIIKPTQTNTVIQGSSTTAILRLNAAKYVTIDGAVSGTNRNLTISNTNTAANTAAVLLSSLNTGTGSGCAFDTLKNCILADGSNTSTPTFALFVGGATIGTQGDDNSYIGITNNQFIRARRGVAVYGTTTNKANNVTLLGNQIGAPGTTTADYISHYGAEFQNADNLSFTQNTISYIIAANTNIKCLFLSTGVTNSSITRNLIDTCFFTGTGGWGVYGIDVNTAGVSGTTIANNMISRLYADGYQPVTSTDALIGIKLNSGSNYNIYNNTVRLAGTYAGAASATECAAYQANATVSGINLRNNIFMNSFVNSGGTTPKSYAIASSAVSTSYASINYNNYNATGTQSVLGLVGTTEYTSLSTLASAITGNANSITRNVNFAANSDLHLTGTSVGDTLLKCAPVSGITTDFDGQNRYTVWHYMGADEITSSPLPVKLSYFVANAEQENANLIWATASEQNTDIFIIERSADAINFEAIAKLKAAGNSSTLIKYNYVDANAKAINSVLYYRLKQVDMDGKFAYSETQKVLFDGMSDGGVVIYPNPAEGEVSIKTFANQTGPVTVTVATIAGMQVCTKIVRVEKGEAITKLPELNNLAAGVYAVSTEINGTTTTHKLVKLK